MISDSTGTVFQRKCWVMEYFQQYFCGQRTIYTKIIQHNAKEIVNTVHCNLTCHIGSRGSTGQAEVHDCVF
jgi:hypothetical protein